MSSQPASQPATPSQPATATSAWFQDAVQVHLKQYVCCRHMLLVIIKSPEEPITRFQQAPISQLCSH
jgi:hypothetical protein